MSDSHNGRDSQSRLTWRVQGIPESFDHAALEQVIRGACGLDDPEEDDEDDVLIQTLALDAYRRTQQATVRFRQTPPQFETQLGSAARGPARPQFIFKIPRQKGETSRGSRQLMFDAHFKGQTVLYDPISAGQEHETDVLAISGLGSHAYGSFVNKDDGHMWLADDLPERYPTARVLLWGFDSQLQDSTSFAHLGDFAHNLRVIIRRHLQSERKRPLVLIGHSLGGLLIKEAVANLSEDPDLLTHMSNIKILFFGVPHHGMDIGSLRAMVNDQPNRSLLESLAGSNSPILQSLNYRFGETLQKTSMAIYCLYETEESPTAIQDPVTGRYSMKGSRQCLVNFASATACLQLSEHRDRAFPIFRSHSDLVKFSYCDPEYNDKVDFILCALLRQEIQPAHGIQVDQRPQFKLLDRQDDTTEANTSQQTASPISPQNEPSPGAGNPGPCQDHVADAPLEKAGTVDASDQATSSTDLEPVSTSEDPVPELSPGSLGEMLVGLRVVDSIPPTARASSSEAEESSSIPSDTVEIEKTPRSRDRETSTQSGDEVPQSPANSEPVSETKETKEAHPVPTLEHKATLTRNIMGLRHYMMAISPDSKLLGARNTDGELNVWDLATGNHLWKSRGKPEVRWFSFSPDGRRIAGLPPHGSPTAPISIWNTTTWQCEVRGRAPSFFEKSLEGSASPCWSPDSSWIVCAYKSLDATVQVRDGLTGALLHDLSMVSAYGPCCLNFSPDGSLLAIGYTHGITRLWNTKTFTIIAVLPSCEPPSRRVLFSPDGSRLLLRSRKRGTTAARRLDTQTFIICDARTGDEIGRRDADFFAGFSAVDNRAWAISDNGGVYVWDLVNARTVWSGYLPDMSERRKQGRLPKGELSAAFSCKKWVSLKLSQPVTDSRHIAQVTDLVTGKISAILKTPRRFERYEFLAFNGRYVLIRGYDGLKGLRSRSTMIWDLNELPQDPELSDRTIFY